MATRTTTKTEITVPAIDIRHITLKIVGDSPLIMHKWSHKAKQEMLDKQMKKAKKGREAKDPVADFIESIYWLDGEPEEKTEEGFTKAIENGAKFGFPTVAFKASAVAAGYRAGVTKDKVSTNGAFHIDGEFVEIQGATPEMREDMVRVGMGTADIRYRGEFRGWFAEITVKYNATAISAEQIVNLFNLGGFACGIGEWRPEKGGTSGMFHVE
ncbi:hypothetical protein LJC49_06725 [Ruminococcaceae bacterium OttesenSCG-928-I18]|nr:hypothetical protein [Ruminococcaceae bacterium OttesenSCG-928-I18]